MKSRLRILTVEDEPSLTDLLAIILGGPAAKVVNAPDGWIALMKVGAAAEPFDVVITDHNMGWRLKSDNIVASRRWNCPATIPGCCS